MPRARLAAPPGIDGPLPTAAAARRGVPVWLGWVATVLVLVALGWVAATHRDQAIRTWPPVARAYHWVGLTR